MLSKNSTAYLFLLVSLPCYSSQELNDPLSIAEGRRYRVEISASIPKVNDRDELLLAKHSLRGDYNKVKSLLESNCDLNYADVREKKTALMASAIMSNVRITEMFVNRRHDDNEVEIDLQDCDGNTALIYAGESFSFNTDKFFFVKRFKHKSFLNSLFSDDSAVRVKCLVRRFVEHPDESIGVREGVNYCSKKTDLQYYLDAYERAVHASSSNVLLLPMKFFKDQSAKRIIYLLLNRGADYTIKNNLGEFFDEILKNSCSKDAGLFEEIFQESKNVVQNRWNTIALACRERGLQDDLIILLFQFFYNQANNRLAIKAKSEV